MTPELSIEPLIGWRVWSLVMRRAGRVPALQPAAAGRGEWFARRPLRATCRRVELPTPELRARHRSPVDECTCGIYASSSLRTLVTSTPTMPAVSAVGTVALWGRVFEHERGWRAEFAYPDRLTLVCVVCLQEGSGAGEPAFVVAEPMASGPYPAVAVCRDHAPSVTSGPRVMSPAAVIRSALLDRYAVDLMPFDSVRSLFERDPVPVSFTVPRTQPPRLASAPARSSTPSVPAGQVGPGAPTGPPTALTLAPPQRDGLPLRVAQVVGRVVTFVLQAAFFLLMCAWGLQSCIVTVQPSDAATTPPSVFIPVPEATDPSTLMAVRRPPDRDVSEMTVVCGRPHGEWVELRGCSNRGATLFGFADSPPIDHCPAGTVAFTQRPRYSICWISVGEVDVIRHPAAADPFEDER